MARLASPKVYLMPSFCKLGHRGEETASPISSGGPWNQTEIRPGEDASGRHDDAEKSQVERDGGGAVEAGNLEGGIFLIYFVGASMVLDDELAGEAARGGAEAVGDGLEGGVLGPDEEVAEGSFVGGERGGDEVGRRGEAEAQLREEGPHAAPAAGQDAGPTAGGGGVEAEQDENKGVVWKRAEVVLAGAGGVAGRLGAHADGDLPTALDIIKLSFTSSLYWYAEPMTISLST
ncbi:hypothetical protein EJB05_13930, partial [Eragrostis curvula]